MDKIKQLEFRIKSNSNGFNNENRNYENFDDFRQNNLRQGDIFEKDYYVENKTNLKDNNRPNNRYNLSSENKDDIYFVDNYGDNNKLDNNNVRLNGYDNDNDNDKNDNINYGGNKLDVNQNNNDYNNDYINYNDINNNNNNNNYDENNHNSIEYNSNKDENNNRNNDQNILNRDEKELKKIVIENNFLSNICVALENEIKNKNKAQYSQNKNDNKNENENKNEDNHCRSVFDDDLIRNVEYSGDVSLLSGEGLQNSAAAFQQMREIMMKILIENKYLTDFKNEINDDRIPNYRIKLFERFSESVILFIYNLLSSFSYTSVPSPFPSLSSNFTLHPSNTLFSPLPSSTSFPNTGISIVQKKKKSSR